ncbi:unnamed protein product [Schistosoma curassoni]|uniref:Proteasome assembly chaperone 3 n=1 Tax=Schistosoma curassoni TaxID=6186 RepID=A0A183L785_9TREM|nr:unnamed protein product [Schistosoma curassoni]
MPSQGLCTFGVRLSMTDTATESRGLLSQMLLLSQERPPLSDVDKYAYVLEPDECNLDAMLVKLVPLLLSQDDFNPPLYIGMISDCDQLDGIKSNSQILAKILVNLIAKIGPPSLKTSGANPSGPVTLPRFRLTIAF